MYIHIYIYIYSLTEITNDQPSILSNSLFILLLSLLRSSTSVSKLDFSSINVAIRSSVVSTSTSRSLTLFSKLDFSCSV